MFVGVMSLGQIKKIRFVFVKIYRSNSNQFLVILIRSSNLASLKAQFMDIVIKSNRRAIIFVPFENLTSCYCTIKT